MRACPRHLPAALSLALAGLCAGCLTLQPYPDAPRAQLDPAPPKPIRTALPPVAATRGMSEPGRVTRDESRANSYPEPATTAAPAAPSPLGDLIMGRTPPPPPPSVLPPQTFPSLGETSPVPTPAAPKTGRKAKPEGRGTAVESRAASDPGSDTREAKRETPPTNPGADMPATALSHTSPAAPLPTPTTPDTRRPTPAPRLAPLDTRLMALNFRQIIGLQTLLDRQNFSCNCADGKIGSRTHAALRAFQKARGLPVTGEPTVATLAVLGDLGGAFASYTIGADDHAQLTQNPTTWLARSQATRLGYQTILEAIAERGHATQQAIRDLNPQVTAWPDPPAGTTLTIPDVGSATPLPHAARIRISIGNKLVRVYDGAGGQLAQFPCSIARDPKKREPCEITVAVVAPNPNYTFDPALFSDEPESATIPTKLIIPPGPRNPVGSAWVGLSKTGYGMHGTPKPEDIGKTESHGCFRLSNWNAQKLLRTVDIGTPVSVEE